MSKTRDSQQPQQQHRQEWWGVQNEKGEWAFANSVVVHYPSKEIAEAHAKTLSPRWSAKKFAD